MTIMKFLFILMVAISTANYCQATLQCSFNKSLMLNELSERIDTMHSTDQKYFDEGFDTSDRTNASILQSVPDSPMSQSKDDANRAIEFTKYLLKCETYGRDVEKLRENPKVKEYAKLMFASCNVEPPSCKYQENAYRTADGSCNNLKYPLWGAAGQPQERLLPPDYDDGIGAPRGKRNSRRLPNPRTISNVVHDETNGEILDEYATVMLMQYGQLLTHDVVQSPGIRGTGGAFINCCAEDREKLSPEICITIPVSKSDPFFQKLGMTCMNMVRSAPADVCPPAYRQQLNAVTSVIDASFVYGSSDTVMDSLRQFKHGFLKFEPPCVSLPTTPRRICRQADVQKCFIAGDNRVNQTPGLSAIHALCVRVHNLIAAYLGKGSHWNDERTFQETRRIVAAIIQHITYSEYLPLVIGDAIMHKYGLNEKETGYDNVYDEKVRPDTTNSFAAAALRYGHSTINRKQRALKKDGSTAWEFPLSQMFNTPLFANLKPGVDGIMRWITTDRTQTTDRFFTKSIRNELFIAGNRSLDLVSINTQRGRDHGIPGYNLFRDLFDLPKFKSQGRKILNPADHTMDVAKLLNRLYYQDDDIDLYTAGVTEKSPPGVQVGPLFANIIGLQFQRYKTGDRYHFENQNPNPKVGFTEAQVNEIKKLSMSKLLCMAIDIDGIQKNAFMQEHYSSNPRMNCSDFEKFDFSLFTAKY